ncbi:spore coat protein [Priestia megaterium]|uniref:spore coat protein n=1 Tax=Priestia megaterium TaxID=1404 RepID=UPI003C9FB09A
MNNHELPTNMQTGAVPPQLNHGGHELFDVHETLAGSINVMDQFMMFRQYVKEQELLDIIDRQYQFILNEYNLIVEAFSTGQKPADSTHVYNMKQSHTFVYGLKPSQPKKPNQSVEEINEKGISGHMLGLVKSQASLLTMTALEITNPVVRRIFGDSVPNWIEMAYEISLYQNKHHYYQVPQLAKEDMQQMITSFAKATVSPQMPNNHKLH